MTPRTITIELPLPDKVLSPNARGKHWAKKSHAVKMARMVAGGIARSAWQQQEPMEKATLQATFYHRTKAKRDDDNLNGSLKAYRDGIADAGVVRDDHDMKNLEPIQLIDKEKPRVEITVTEVVNDVR